MNKIKKIIKQITVDNKEEIIDSLFDDGELNEYYLNKVLDWQTNYIDDYTWFEFKDMIKCGLCGWYSTDSCICYTGK